MNKQMILEYIDNIDQSMVESELDVCAAILEYYDKSRLLVDYDENQVFQEAAKTEQTLGAKVKNVLARIVTAINKMFNKIVNKICGGSSSEGDKSSSKEMRAAASLLGDGKITAKKRDTFKKKNKSFRKEHPVFVTLMAFTATAGAIYAGGKALDAAGKKFAAKDLTEEDRKWISEHFDPSTNSVWIPYNMTSVINSINEGYNVYNNCVNALMHNLGMSGESEMTKEGADRFIKEKKYKDVVSSLNRAEEIFNTFGNISGGNEKTVIKNGSDGWKDFINKIDDMFGKVTEMVGDCTIISNLCWDVVTTASDEYANDADYDPLKIVRYCERQTKDLNRISDIQQELIGIDATVQKYYAKYYAVADKIQAIKEDIGEALVLAGRIFAAASGRISDEEWAKVKQLENTATVLESQINSMEKTINAQKVTKDKYSKEINQLKTERRQLEEKIAAIEKKFKESKSDKLED